MDRDASPPETIDESVLRRFEAAWHAGNPLPIEHLLPSQDSSYSTTLEELVALELEYLWKSWDQTPREARQRPRLLESYLERFPALRTPAVVLRLVKEEWRVRRWYGDTPDVGEYWRRFPDVVTSAESLIDAITYPADKVDSVPGPASLPNGYELGEELGSGGMGVVYRARDRGLDRPVAVKSLQPSLTARGDAVARFLNEARITGRLQHPGIPPVHQVGTLPDGRPFLAMKLIRGETLDVLLKARPDPAQDRGRFLAVFEQVCQAVACAHGNGVIHRDLKPANVMVGAFGEVQVMDWGLAKVLADRERERLKDGSLVTPVEPDATRPGSILGTPSYMSPEQAAGAVDRVDERSDVFGLGAILCVILTGKPPNSVGPDSEVAEDRLGPALTRLEVCGAEPDLIDLCKRCLAMRSEDRPRNAGQVAEAVAGLRSAAEERARQAELARVRVEGEQAKAAAEAREQRKRRRVQLGLAAALGLLVAAGGVFGWWRDRQATRNADALESLLATCEGALRAGDADKAAAALAEAERRASDGGGGRFQGRLDACQADFQLLRDLNEIDRFRWTPIDARDRSDVGEPDRSAVRSRAHYPTWEEVLSRWRVALGRFRVDPEQVEPDVVAARVAASSLRDRLVVTLDRWNRKERSHRVRSVLEMVDPDPYRGLVRDAYLAEDWAARTAELAGRAEALSQPDWFVAFLGEGRQLDTDVGRRRAMLITALARQPGNLDLLMALGGTYPVHRPDGAGERVRWFQAAVAVHPRAVAARLNLAVALHDQDKLDEAIAAFREAINLDPNWPTYHNLLGNALSDKKDWNGAMAAYKEAIRLDPTWALPHCNLGNVIWDKGDLDGAITEYRVAIQLDPKLALGHNNLAVALRKKGDSDGALVEYKEAVRLDPKNAAYHDKLGDALNRKGDPAGALAEYKEAVRLDPKDPLYHTSLGNALYEKKDWDGAVAAYKEAVRLNPKNAEAYFNLGFSLYRVGEVDEAITANREAIRLDPNYVRAHHNLGIGLTRKGNTDGAIAEYREAIRLDPNYAPARYYLGAALRAKGNLDGAITQYREAIRCDSKWALPHRSLAWVLATGPDGLRHGKKAVEHATRGCELTDWKDSSHLDTLGAAYAEAGEFARAIEYQNRVVTDQEYVSQYAGEPRQRLALYTQKKPYRDPALQFRTPLIPPREVKQ